MLDPARILERCDALARHSELPGSLTRVFLSPQARAATDLVLGWMREAGMEAFVPKSDLLLLGRLLEGRGP